MGPCVHNTMILRYYTCTHDYAWILVCAMMNGTVDSASSVADVVRREHMVGVAIESIIGWHPDFLGLSITTNTTTVVLYYAWYDFGASQAGWHLVNIIQRGNYGEWISVVIHSTGEMVNPSPYVPVRAFFCVASFTKFFLSTVYPCQFVVYPSCMENMETWEKRCPPYLFFLPFFFTFYMFLLLVLSTVSRLEKRFSWRTV